MQFGFKHTRQLEHWIDAFNNTMVDAALEFEKAVADYLEERPDDFNHRYELIRGLENKADDLRRDVEKELYSHTLIPESRGDVLSILENSDNVVDCIKETIMEFSVQQPDIPSEYDQDFMALSRASRDSVEALVDAVQRFFSGERNISTYIHKVYFYEKEADMLSEKIKRAVFSSDCELASKLQLNRFVQQVENVSNYAEAVADRLAIYAIKRQI